mmetsp:Transcript_14994/g.22654  ORF Transcript_14994/g.22654 Transcript_14994/m.22654 type:complete len:222 (-) Transcript_14994:229-894(-)
MTITTKKIHCVQKTILRGCPNGSTTLRDRSSLCAPFYASAKKPRISHGFRLQIRHQLLLRRVRCADQFLRFEQRPRSANSRERCKLFAQRTIRVEHDNSKVIFAVRHLTAKCFGGPSRIDQDINNLALSHRFRCRRSNTKLYLERLHIAHFPITGRVICYFGISTNRCDIFMQFSAPETTGRGHHVMTIVTFRRLDESAAAKRSTFELCVCCCCCYQRHIQ